MATYRYWYLDDQEDPENDSIVNADDAREAAELACEEIINDGDTDTCRNNKIELAVRSTTGGPAEMFEVFVDWSPNCTAYARGQLPEPS